MLSILFYILVHAFALVLASSTFLVVVFYLGNLNSRLPR